LKDNNLPEDGIKDIELVNDRETGRFKGQAYVEFSSPSNLENALKCHDQEILGRRVRIEQANSRAGPRGRGRDASPSRRVDQVSRPVRGGKRAFLGNLSFNVSENDIREFFEQVSSIFFYFSLS
jgi:RNA recognition motif-containing protein